MFHFSLFIYLQKHPEVGVFSSLTAFMIAFIKSSMPVIQWVSAAVFLLIGLITLYEKIKINFFKKKKPKCDTVVCYCGNCHQ